MLLLRPFFITFTLEEMSTLQHDGFFLIEGLKAHRTVIFNVVIQEGIVIGLFYLIGNIWLIGEVRISIHIDTKTRRLWLSPSLALDIDYH